MLDHMGSLPAREAKVAEQPQLVMLSPGEGPSRNDGEALLGAELCETAVCIIGNGAAVCTAASRSCTCSAANKPATCCTAAAGMPRRIPSLPALVLSYSILCKLPAGVAEACLLMQSWEAVEFAHSAETFSYMGGTKVAERCTQPPLPPGPTSDAFTRGRQARHATNAQPSSLILAVSAAAAVIMAFSAPAWPSDTMPSRQQ